MNITKELLIIPKHDFNGLLYKSVFKYNIGLYTVAMIRQSK